MRSRFVFVPPGFAQTGAHLLSEGPAANEFDAKKGLSGCRGGSAALEGRQLWQQWFRLWLSGWSAAVVAMASAVAASVPLATAVALTLLVVVAAVLAMPAGATWSEEWRW